MGRDDILYFPGIPYVGDDEDDAEEEEARS